MLYGKNEILKNPFNILFFVFQALSLSVFLYLLLLYFKPGMTESPWLLLRITTFYTVFVTAKMMVEKIISNIFSIDNTYDNYLFQKMSYRNIISVLVFVANLFLIYIFPGSKSLLLIFAAFFTLLNLISLLSIYRRNRSKISSYFSYFILYLCALEVSPYIILYKLVASIST